MSKILKRLEESMKKTEEKLLGRRIREQAERVIDLKLQYVLMDLAEKYMNNHTPKISVDILSELRLERVELLEILMRFTKDRDALELLTTLQEDFKLLLIEALKIIDITSG